jgi:hypothetical protein
VWRGGVKEAVAQSMSNVGDKASILISFLLLFPTTKTCFRHEPQQQSSFYIVGFLFIFEYYDCVIT